MRAEGALNPLLARRLVVQKGEVGHRRGWWKTDLGPSTKAREEESGLKGGAGEKEGGDESACLSFFCCANVTSDC